LRHGNVGFMRNFVFSNIPVRFVHHHMERDDLNRFIGLVRSSRHRANRNTHINEKKWRKERGRKWFPITLPPDYQKEKNSTMNSDQMRISMLRKGVNIGKDIGARTWQEYQITYQSFCSCILNFSFTVLFR